MEPGTTAATVHLLDLPLPVLLGIASFVYKPSALFQSCSKWRDISDTGTFALEWLWNNSGYNMWDSSYDDQRARRIYPLYIVTPAVLEALIRRVERFLSLLENLPVAADENDDAFPVRKNPNSHRGLCEDHRRNILWHACHVDSSIPFRMYWTKCPLLVSVAALPATSMLSPCSFPILH